MWCIFLKVIRSELHEHILNWKKYEFWVSVIARLSSEYVIWSVVKFPVFLLHTLQLLAFVSYPQLLYHRHHANRQLIAFMGTVWAWSFTTEKIPFSIKKYTCNFIKLWVVGRSKLKIWFWIVLWFINCYLIELLHCLFDWFDYSFKRCTITIRNK